MKCHDNGLDFVKGLAIILMVYGHAITYWGAGRFVHDFIYLFHMSLFFIASGFVFNRSCIVQPRAGGGVIGFIWKRCKRLWFVYGFWACAFTIFVNVLISCNVYTDNPQIAEYVKGNMIGTIGTMSFAQILKQCWLNLMMIGTTQLTGACWFLKSIFYISVGYAIVEWICVKIRVNAFCVQGVLAIILCVLSEVHPCGCVLEKVYFVFDGHQTFRGYMTFFLGVALAASGMGFTRLSVRRASIVAWVSFALLSVILILCGPMHAYHGVPFLKMPTYVISALLGWCLVNSIYRITEFLGMHKLTISLAFIGRHTMPILIFHFLAFKSVSFVGTLIYGHPAFVTAAFPIAYSGLGWSLAYTLAGIGLPLLLICVPKSFAITYSNDQLKEDWR